MNNSITYSEREQTTAQRQELIDKARAWSVAQGAVPGPAAEAVYARYVAGELTLQDVTDELKSYYANRAAAPAGAASPAAPQGMMEPEELLLAS
ncbi:antitoxin VbhA family protein [Hymenobacter cellulosilyticus]|uniref:Antitoxin VbhA family protein n=1 Tax=Hymenobacter cellulosilyticus TaxID=2932248 RepID=A0A8T9QG66_9BACT|nr:antitoxin VbhA family protein [Hymenobacter cellulosilyticus]UOQ75148.1 antitoxin VbhA family protein [Hymenobacter cellulosilyticus]